jgi:adenylate cyclase
MAVYEIERKFLVKEIPENIELCLSEEIVQGYLAVDIDGTEIRVRKKGNACYLTIKKGKGMKRHEVEIELLQEQFDTLWPKTEGRQVGKERITIPEGSVIIELDIYHGALEGLKTAEVEFRTQDEADAFSPPSWIGKEITWDERYKNKNLALHGLPEESS